MTDSDPSEPPKRLIYVEASTIEGKIELYNQSIALDPDPFGFINRGWLYYAIGKLREARADFDSAVKCDPKWHVPYKHRARYRLLVANLPGAALDMLRAWLRRFIQWMHPPTFD